MTLADIFHDVRVFPKQQKSDISGNFVQNFKISKKLICLPWELNSQYQLSPDYNSNALLTQPICHSLPVTDFQTLMKSCFIESTNDPSPKSEVLFYTCLGGRVE